MSEKTIRAALEEKLKAFDTLMPIAWENVNFDPTPGDPYFRVNLMRAEPENPAIGDRLRRYLGVLQVSLCYPQGVGPGVVEAKADALAAYFPRALTLVKNGINVVIDGTPYVMTGFADGDRWVVPVRIPYFSNVST